MAETRKILLDVQARTGDAEKRLQDITLELAQNRTELRELNKAYQQGLISNEKYGKSVAELTVENKELGAEQRQLQRQIINTNKATNSLEGSNEQLKAQLSLLRAEYDRLSQAGRESTEEGRRLTQVTDEITQTLKANEAAIGDNRRNVGNYTSALDGLSGAINKVLPGFSGVISGAKSGNEGFAKIAGSAGKLGGVAGKLGKILGGPLVAALVSLVAVGVKAAEAIADVTREFEPLRRQVNALTGAEGDSLDALTGRIQGIAKTFDADFNDVLRAANTAAVEFGIPITDALTQIEEGFLNGASVSGQYLDTLQEYPSQLRAVGLSLEETNALLLQQTQDGVFSDKGIDAIKEAGLRLRELPDATRKALDGIGLQSDVIQESLETNSTTIFEVIQQVSGKLGELEEDSPEVGAAIADIFGGPGEDAGLRYIKTLANIDRDLSSVSLASEEFVDRQRRQLELTQDLSAAQAELSGNFAPVVAAFDRFGDFVLLKVVQGFNAIVEFITVTIPAGFRGFIAVVGQARQALQDFVNRTVLDIQIVAKEVQNFFSFSDTVESELNDLRTQRAGFAETGTSLAEAFSEAYNESVTASTLNTAARIVEAEREATRIAGIERKKREEQEAAEREKAAAAALREAERVERERIQILRDGINERIAEEQLGIIEIENNRLLSEQRRIELVAEREQRIADLRKETALIGIEESSAEYKLIIAQTAQEIVEIERQAQAEIQAIRDAADAQEAAEIAQRLEAERLAADEAVRIAAEQSQKEFQLIEQRRQAERAAAEEKKILQEQGLNLAQQTFSAAANLLGEQSALGKAAAIASATISTYQAAATALANPPGPPFTIPLAAIAVAAGLQQVRQIVSVQEPSFADGGPTGRGFAPDRAIPGRRIAGIVHDNEYVVPSAVLSNPVGASLVSGLERIRQTGSFANGGFTGVQSAADQSAAAVATGNQLTQAIKSLPNPVVDVREITDTQTRVTVKENTGRL